MATALKDPYGPDVAQAIGQIVQAVYPAFDHSAFLADALHGFDALELMARGKHLAKALHRNLPGGYADALAIVLASIDQPHPRDPSLSMASFLYLPHTHFVAQYGLDHFDLSMQALHMLTQRFTAEFAIRPFLAAHPQATLQQLTAWTHDPSPHVRRLVSEGTRTRLPWAGRLPQFQKDPAPVLALLECLKDDPALYVRRSVANNLNDIGKDHPALLADTARRWLDGASPQRRWIVEHALRYAVKRGDPGALAALGYGAAQAVVLRNTSIAPQRLPVGAALTIRTDVHNPGTQPMELLVDVCVHYVKANGTSRPKVFKIKTLCLPPGGTATLRKGLSLKDRTTRKHFPGLHRVGLLVNGQEQALGAFEVMA
jgi:3-methyladenine DNA glycosylase AlkC